MHFGHTFCLQSTHCSSLINTIFPREYYGLVIKCSKSYHPNQCIKVSNKTSRLPCSNSVIYSYSNKSILCAILFHSPSCTKCISSLRTIKQNKMILSCSQVACFQSTNIFQWLSFNFILDCLVIYFMCIVLFNEHQYSTFMEHQTGAVIEQLIGTPWDSAFI